MFKLFIPHIKSKVREVEAHWQIPVFRYGLLMRNRGYLELETLEKPCCSYLGNIKTAINYFLQTIRS
jgi:hypothetical protein